MSKMEILHALHQRDEIILRQSRRIKLLEDKYFELRMRFFKMKYHDLYDELPRQIKIA